MSIGFYMDVHVQRPITNALRQRGIRVVTAREDGTARLSDQALLDRAAVLALVLFTRDSDFLGIAAERQRTGRHFSGVVYAHPTDVPLAICIDDLELVAGASGDDEMANRLEHLPLR